MKWLNDLLYFFQSDSLKCIVKIISITSVFAQHTHAHTLQKQASFYSSNRKLLIQWWCHGWQVQSFLTSAVSCLWASLAAPKCCVSSSFSTAYYINIYCNKNDNAIKALKCWYFRKVIPSEVFSYQLCFLLQVHDLGEKVRDLLLLPGSIVALFGQLLRQGRYLQVGIAWRDQKWRTKVSATHKVVFFLFVSLISTTWSPSLTQLFDAVVDELLLFFLVGDGFCLQVARLELWI